MINKIIQLASLKPKKRGSHVGVVISFVMFVAFITFFYLIIQPTITSESKKNLFDYLREQTNYLFSDELTEVSILTDGSSNCIKLTNFLPETGIGNRIIARGDSGLLNSQVYGNDLYVGIGGNNLLWIYGSKEFATNEGTMSGCSSEYTLGLVKKYKIIFETKISEFIKDYSTDYENTKQQLKIPEENEFELDFIYADGTIISAQNIQLQSSASSINLYVNEIPIQYISTDGKMESGVLRIKIW